MAQQDLNLGTLPNDDTGDSIRVGGQKIQDNFTELYTTKLEEVQEGTNVTVDNTDPLRPIVNAIGLQSGDNISELNNDSLFITTAALPTNTSDLVNDGDDTVNPFVSVNELGATAFSNDYDDLDNKPVIPPTPDGTETIVQSGTNTTVTGDGSIGDPYIINATAVATDEGQLEISTSTSLVHATHNNKVIIVNNGASNINITIPSSLSDDFRCGFIQHGTGTVTFVASGTTLRSANGLIIDGQYNQAFVQKRNAGTNEFHILGNLTT